MTVPLPAYHRGRTALLGDAAHAMAPTLGQGGNQAVEDAVVLAHHLTQGRPNPSSALAAYTRDRLPRTTGIVRRSARTARLAMLTGVPAVAARDLGITAVSRLAPSALLRGFDGIADWRPPVRTYAAQTERTNHMPREAQ